MAVSITYNNLSSPSSLITFTDIPNILKVSDNANGTKAMYNIQMMGDLYSITTADTQWSITIFGDTISNVLNPKNAVNKNFYVGRTVASTSASIVKALRNCPNIVSNFTVDFTNNMGAQVIRLIAYDIGSKANGQQWFSTNISSSYIASYGTDGNSDSQLQGALVDVDIYANQSYVTTLEKNFYDGETAFDLSPVLTTVSKVGETVPYFLRVSAIKSDGEYSLLGSVNTNYSSVGYMCNQGYKYIPLASSIELAQNVSRGKSREFTNNTLLYVYQPRLDFSVYAENILGKEIVVKYMDSAFNQISAYTTSYQTTHNSKLYDLGVNLHWMQDAFNNAFYVDIEMDGIHLRYNVIKPLKATEYSQRIYWRNSYGGISFFDFTGARSETRTLELMTYQKNIFGYYDSPKNELEKAYDNDVEYSVTLKSHLFENDGKYIFNDLMQSSEVWTEINGEQYAILLDSVSVEEQNNNNIYEATVKYRYSMKPSIL